MDINQSLELYKKKQILLKEMLSSGASAINSLNMPTQVEELNNLSKKVEEETFKVMVIGQFNSGKSTFINSFLGEEVLPAYATPCTAVINEVKYEKNKRAILFFKNPLPDKLPEGIPPKTLNHIKKSSGKISPIEIPYNEIEEYAVIPMGKELKDLNLESPYEKIELYWPLDILQSGVEIIDSPGLNEKEIRTKVTLEYLSKADAVLFILSSLQPCAKTEMDFIDLNLHNSGFYDIYFIFNRFDQLPSSKEKEKVRNFGIEKLKRETSFGEKGIFFISAIQGIEGKIKNDKNLLVESGVAELEKSLSEFLTKEKGKIKLSQPSKELKRVISEALFTSIPQQKSMLGQDLSKIEKNYASAKPQLDNLQNKKRMLSEKITFYIERIMPDIKRCIEDYLENLSKVIPSWLDEIEVENEFKTFKPKESSELIIKELLEKMQVKIEHDQLEWQNKTLMPLITTKIQEVLYAIESNMVDFFVNLDKIKVDISGKAAENVEGQRDISVFERAGAAALGFFAGDIGSATIGGTFGFSKTFFTQLALQIGAVIAMLLFGITNPITMLPVIIGIAVFGFFRGKSGIIDQLKGKVASATIQELNKILEQSVNDIVKDLKAQINELGDGIIGALDSEISTLKIQVESIIKDLKAGEESVSLKKKNLQQCENDLIKINKELDTFILGLLENK